MEMATKEDFLVAETWLQSNHDTNLKPTDNQVVNPYAVVSDQHGSECESGKNTNQSKSLPESNSTTSSYVMADSEGDCPPNQRKRSGCASADTTPASTLMSPIQKGTTGAINDFDSNRTTDNTSVNEQSMPTRINLKESGLRRSARIAALNAKNASHEPKAKSHVAYGARAARTLIGLFSLFCFASNITLPKHRVAQNMTYTDLMINKLEEIHEH